MEWSAFASLGTGWLTLCAIFVAATVPLGAHLKLRRRAAPRSSPIKLHVSIGVATAVAAFIHALFGVLSLGSARAIGGGNAARFAGAGALLVLVAHVGIGLQLHDPKLKKRPETRRKHVVTATIIAVCALLHVVLLRSAAE